MRTQRQSPVALAAERVDIGDRRQEALLHGVLRVASEERLSWEETILLIEEIERRTGIWLRLVREQSVSANSIGAN